MTYLKGILFASVNDWSISYKEYIQAALDGSWASTDTWCGMTQNCLTLSEFKNMPADVVSKVKVVANGISSGALNVFKGPIITNEGAVISWVATLNDGDLWGMNYYVQGVIGKVPN